MPIQHLLEEFGKENDGGYKVTTGVNPQEISRRLLLSLVWSGARITCATILDQTVRQFHLGVAKSAFCP